MEGQDTISINEFFKSIRLTIRYFLRQWWKLAIFVLIGCIIGFLVAMFRPITYTAKISFILEDNKGSSSGLSAIAGQLGIDFGSNSGASLLAGDNILGLLKSKAMVKKALLCSFDSGGNYSVADRYADVYGMRQKWKKNTKIAKDIYFPSNGSKFTILQDSLIQVIQNRIITGDLSVERPDKKMSFINVAVTLEDQQLAKRFTENLVNGAVAFYVETKTRRQRANVDRLQGRADSIGGLLNSRTYSAAIRQSEALDINPAYQSAAVRAEVGNRDKVMIATIYGEVVKNLEIQKATLTQETPVIQVVDNAELPLVKNRASKLSSMLLGGIFGLLVSTFLLYIQFRMRVKT